MRFFTNPRKPMILALARPDPKKNITTLVKAFGECRPLRELANLVCLNNWDLVEEDSFFILTYSSYVISFFLLVLKSWSNFLLLLSFNSTFFFLCTLQTLIMGNRDGVDEMSSTNASVLLTVLKLIDKYDLYGQVAYPKHHKQFEVPDIYRLAAKTKV